MVIYCTACIALCLSTADVYKVTTSERVLCFYYTYKLNWVKLMIDILVIYCLIDIAMATIIHSIKKRCNRISVSHCRGALCRIICILKLIKHGTLILFNICYLSKNVQNFRDQ